MRYVAWIGTLCLLTVGACGNLNDDDNGGVVGGSKLDSGSDNDGIAWEDAQDGVCELSKCPPPEFGVACCRPDGHCGTDPLANGLSCQPNPGDPPSGNICILADCPLPTIGNACCTPTGTCGSDPWGLGTTCFANAPIDRTDAGPMEDTCGLADCPLPVVGFSCCTNDKACGYDPNGAGLCWANPADAAVPEIDTSVPDDPSVRNSYTADGIACPSYLGAVGPIWGCCSDYGICGTWAYDACLLPIGTQLPVRDAPPQDEDAGVEPFIRCEIIIPD